MKKLFGETQSILIHPLSIVFAISFLLGLYFVYFIREIVGTLFLAVILMSALNPGIVFMEKRLRVPRILGIFISYIFLIVFLVSVFVIIVPPLAAEIPNFISTLSLPPLPDTVRNLRFNLSEVSSFIDQIRGSFGQIFSIISSAFSGIFGLLTILVMTCYLLLDRENLHKKIIWFTRDKRHLELAKELVDSVEIHLGGWVRGQFLLMITIGLITYVGLTLLGLDYALPLALLAGLLEVLPNLGPTLAAIPAVLIAYLSFGPAMAGFVTLFYVLVQQVENNFIVPKIMKENVDVNPLTTILVILIGLKVSGFLGALLAVPVYIVIRSIYSMWLREQNRQT